ncbi:MAG: hypothetical protein ABIU29_11440 [Chthoniobacterales bacterium]
MKTISFLAVLTVGWYAYRWHNPPVTYPPGVLIASDPVQTEASPDEAPIASGKFQLKALAHFSLDARVLHRKIYRYDHNADVVPVDLAVGWGPSKAIAAQCRSLRGGDLIHLSGLLVEASGPEFGTWRSSITRTDTGNGACELVWVQEGTKIAR